MLSVADDIIKIFLRSQDQTKRNKCEYHSQLRKSGMVFGNKLKRLRLSVQPLCGITSCC